MFNKERNMAMAEGDALVQWQIAVLAWLFLPGGSTKPAAINALIADTTLPNGFVGALRVFMDLIDPQKGGDPSIATAVENLRTGITKLTSANGAMGSRWGYSGDVTPDVVKAISRP